MSLDKDQLLPLLASHICHELASPITGITNALAMIKEDGASATKGQAWDYLSEAVNSAHYLVQFLRQAYGNPTTGTGQADMRLTEELSRHVITGRNRSPQCVWKLSGVEMTAREARVLLSLVFVVSGFLPRGGVVTVSGSAGERQIELSVTAEGDRAMIRDETRAALRGESTPDRPPSTWIAAYYLWSMVTQQGAELAAREADGRIELIARLPRT